LDDFIFAGEENSNNCQMLMTFDVNDPKFSLFSKFADHFNDIVKRSVTHCTKIRVNKIVNPPSFRIRQMCNHPPQPVSIVQDYAVVSDQEHKLKVFDFKARGRNTQDNWAIGNSPIKTDMVLKNLKNYPCKDTVVKFVKYQLVKF
jgi:hypothetical protein